MSIRTKAREFAMQMLFQWEMSPQDASRLEVKFWRSAKSAESTRAFANQLFEGAVRDASECDVLITQNAQNWKFDRLSAIDRAILRLAVYEMRTGATPHKVVLNEAVELAKKFSSEESGGFVNGVLDAVRKNLPDAAPSKKQKSQPN